MGFFNKSTWSSCEIDYLKLHKDNESLTQLAGYLGKSNNAVKNKIIELVTGVAPGKKQSGKKTNIGKRADLNLFVRSSWEANVLRYLQHHKIKYIYEPKVFSFTEFGIKHGTTSYTPDIMVFINETDYIWLEIKGFLKGTDKTKIRRFIKYYPEEAKKLRFITGSATTKATQFFNSLDVICYSYYNDLAKISKSVIPNWE